MTRLLSNDKAFIQGQGKYPKYNTNIQKYKTDMPKSKTNNPKYKTNIRYTRHLFNDKTCIQ